jgi:hypothetical protein
MTDLLIFGAGAFLAYIILELSRPYFDKMDQRRKK